jgi:hypothetical protein
MYMTFQFILVMLVALFFTATIVLGNLLQDERHKRLFELKKFNPYRPTKYFMSNAEKKLFSILSELPSLKDYYIFPQVAVSALVAVKDDADDISGKFDWVSKYCADFVICDKTNILPQLVIELNDSSHKYNYRKARDQFLNTALADANIKLLFLDIKELPNPENIEADIKNLIPHR